MWKCKKKLTNYQNCFNANRKLCYEACAKVSQEIQQLSIQPHQTSYFTIYYVFVHWAHSES